MRLTHLDGKLPNLALMRLAAWHREQGDEVTFSRKAARELFEPERYDRVYGSAIFRFSARALAAFREQWPDAIVGGTGTDERHTVEEVLGVLELERADYSIYPTFTASLGFTQRGCRLRCSFCVVPGKEGRPRTVATVAQLWRGEPWPRHLHLLDNDFFGQPPDEWRARCEEVIAGGFRVCLNQGINVRMITEEAAAWLALLPYYDDQFRRRRLYTAWDSLGDERVFFRGVDRLEAAGVPPRHLLAYMLVGFADGETIEALLYRFYRMTERGIRPYPMLFRRDDPTLRRFQRWAVRRYYTVVPFAEYDANARGHTTETGQLELAEGVA